MASDCHGSCGLALSLIVSRAYYLEATVPVVGCGREPPSYGSHNICHAHGTDEV